MAVLAYVDLADTTFSSGRYEALGNKTRQSWRVTTEREKATVLGELKDCFKWQAATSLIPAFINPTDLFRRAVQCGKSNAGYILVDIQGLGFWWLDNIGERVGYESLPFEWEVGVVWSGEITADRVLCKIDSVSLPASFPE